VAQPSARLEADPPLDIFLTDPPFFMPIGEAGGAIPPPGGIAGGIGRRIGVDIGISAEAPLPIGIIIFFFIQTYP
jgi:hypothetical protein